MKIAANIPFDRILDEVRDSISESGIDRKHLLTKKDLHNIQSSFNINSNGVRHKEDAVSVDSWIREMQEIELSCVLFYKPQDTV